MIRLENYLGRIDISESYLVNLIASTVSQCFGVAGISEAGTTQGVKNWLKTLKWSPFGRFPEKGIKIKYQKQKLGVELHIIVGFGTNVPAVVKNITEKVKYSVEEAVGIEVSSVNVFVDGITKN